MIFTKHIFFGFERNVFTGKEEQEIKKHCLLRYCYISNYTQELCIREKRDNYYTFFLENAALTRLAHTHCK